VKKEHKEKTGDGPKTEEIHLLKEEAKVHKDTLQRLQAEFENFQKRNEREKMEFLKYAGAKTIEEFLPIVDSICEAIKQAEKHENKEMAEGMKKIEEQLMKILEKQGVKVIEAQGKKFDHNIHECVMTGNENEKDDDYVLEEFQKGYTINGKILRPAKVKVNKKER